jgi:hypothetical protein
MKCNDALVLGFLDFDLLDFSTNLEGNDGEAESTISRRRETDPAAPVS